MVDTGASSPSKDNCHCTPAPQNTTMLTPNSLALGVRRIQASAHGNTQLTLPKSRVSDSTLEAMR